MKARTRRKLEMGARAFIFASVHPHPSPGYAANLARLGNRLTRATQLAAQQRDGLLQVRAAAARKRDLLRTMRRDHLAHLRQVARLASRELPELWQLFRLQRGTIPYLTFRTAAYGMAAEATGQRELLVQHGLSEPLLESLAHLLKEFDRAVEQGNQGREAHVGASAELDVVGDEVVRLVRIMRGPNRLRFAHQPGLLAEWASISHVIATPGSSAA